LLLAILAGYSRIYLAQHFLEDIMAGALIGTIFGLVSYHLIWQYINRNTAVNTGLIGVLKI